MARNKDTGYTVVVFYKGLWYTLRADGKPHLFSRMNARIYSNLGSAVKKANRMFYDYVNDRVCVFKVTLGERLSCDQYKDLMKDSERVMWNSDEWFNSNLIEY